MEILLQYRSWRAALCPHVLNGIIRNTHIVYFCRCIWLTTGFFTHHSTKYRTKRVVVPLPWAISHNPSLSTLHQWKSDYLRTYQRISGNMLFYTVYSWATCTHQIMLDARGLRVDPTTIPANSIVTNAYPPHVCLDCAALNTALIEARVQPALPQPMVNTGSNSKVLALARQPPPPRQSPAQHTTRQACRTHNPNCHSHHGMSLACHKPWQQCYHART